MNTRVRLTGLLVLVAVSIGIAELKQNHANAGDLAGVGPTVADARSMDRDPFVSVEPRISAGKIEDAAYRVPSQWSDVAQQTSSSSEDEAASPTDVALMVVFAAGLVMLQLRRRQKSLRHLSLSAS